MGTHGRTSILLAETHSLLRECLRHRLNAEPDLVVVGAVGNGDEAVEQAIRVRPNVVLMGVEMPGLCCFDAARLLDVRSPESRVVLLSGPPHDRHIDQALAARVCGYVVTTESDHTVIEAIRRVAGGQTYFSRIVQERLALYPDAVRPGTENASRASRLTPRELEVIRHITRGLSQKETARAMKISEHTVHRHTTNVMRKLDIHDRVSLARFAIREQLARP